MNYKKVLVVINARLNAEVAELMERHTIIVVTESKENRAILVVGQLFKLLQNFNALEMGI
jgi:ethanolamine utilization protein EutA (predicted chaperonin)